MFTGLVKDLGTVESIRRGLITVRTSLAGIEPGDSVMVDGVCLTACKISRDRVSMEMGAETASVTALKRLRPGSKVNLEDSLTLSSKLGGHIVYGHVMAVGTVASVRRKTNTRLISIRAGKDFAAGLISKGSVAVNGVSLTVNRKGKDFFEVGIIPETVTRTNLGELRVSSRVNLEADLLILSRKEKK